MRIKKLKISTNKLLLKKKKTARYVLVVKSLEHCDDINLQIAQVRREIASQTQAMWLVKEVGAYIVFHVASLPRITENEISVDKTGFHAVIIQGVHFISDANEHLFRHTKWLNHSFGGAQGIAQKIESILG